MAEKTTQPPLAPEPPPAIDPKDPEWIAYQKLAGGTLRALDGKFAAPGAEVVGTDRPPTERAAEEPAGQDDRPPAKPAHGSADEREAFQGLAKRFHVPPRLAEAALAGPREELLAWTDELRKMQGRFDELSGRKAEAKGAPEAQATSQKAGTPKGAEVGTPGSAEKGSDRTERLREAFARNGIDDDAVQAVLEALGERAGGNGAEKDLQAMADQLRALQESQARAGLEQEFPGLADDARYAKVRARVGRWIASGEYSPQDVVGAMRDAARIELWDEAPARSPKSPRRPEPPTEPSFAKDERAVKDPEWDAYARLMRGESVESIRSSYR